MIIACSLPDIQSTIPGQRVHQCMPPKYNNQSSQYHTIRPTIPNKHVQNNIFIMFLNGGRIPALSSVYTCYKTTKSVHWMTLCCSVQSNESTTLAYNSIIIYTSLD